MAELDKPEFDKPESETPVLDNPVLVDDEGTVAAHRPEGVARVVSLVPSLTEAIAETAPGLLVAATDWCTHPADLDVVRIGGTKNPRVDQIVALAPDLVVANDEENRAPDLEALRAAGLAVWVTAPRRLADAFGSLRRMLAACGLDEPAWLDAARRSWSSAFDGTAPTRTAVIPIWRRPWMVVGSDTFAGDVLQHLGVANVYAGHPERYPKVALDELRSCGADLVVLPDEPYAFSADDGPEAFDALPVALVSGRHLTWYGPSLLEARDLLEQQLAAARPGTGWPPSGD
jgi:ABC-type Fe3+-hydroxamate transport system substrate-binding protein